MDEWNYTLNITEIYEEELTNAQYIYAAFSGLSILPNIFIICLLMKSKLAPIAEYTIIINWCIFNILFILNYIYLYIMPNENIDDAYYSFSYYSSSVLIASTAILVILLNIEYILQSDKLYKRILFLVWVLSIGYILCLYVAYFTELIDSTFINWVEYLQNTTLCVLSLVFIVNLFIVSMQSGKYKNFKARIILSLIFLLCYILRWSIGNDYFNDYYSVILTMISIFLFYSNGFMNIVVLVSFDVDVKGYFTLKEDKSEVAKNVEF